MKLTNITDIDGFCRAIEECKGDVILTTTEGDRLNLKSCLSRYVAFFKLFSDESMIKEIDLSFSENEDVARMIKFAILG